MLRATLPYFEHVATRATAIHNQCTTKGNKNDPVPVGVRLGEGKLGTAGLRKAAQHVQPLALDVSDHR